MSKHRTRKQKVKTAERRIEVLHQLSEVSPTQTGLKYSLLSGDALKPITPLSKERAWDNQRVMFFKKDMLKTVFVSALLVGIILLLKWKLTL